MSSIILLLLQFLKHWSTNESSGDTYDLLFIFQMKSCRDIAIPAPLWVVCPMLLWCSAHIKWDSWKSSPYDVISPFYEEGEEVSVSKYTHEEVVGAYSESPSTPRREECSHQEPVGTLILNFPFSRIMKTKCVLLKATSLLRGASLLKAQKGPGKALKEAIPCPATPW